MDRVGVLNHKYNNGKKQARKKALKVVYISSPMKVKTSVSKFRALVQELTGRESDVARLMETNGVDQSQDVRGFRHVDDYNHVFNNPPTNGTDGGIISSPASSEELSFDDLFAPYGNAVDESYTGLLLPSGFMYENYEADLVRSFDAAV